jgi:ribosomal protein S27E
MTPEEAAVASKVAARLNGGAKLRTKNIQVQCPHCGNASIVMHHDRPAQNEEIVVDCGCGEQYTVKRTATRVETVDGEALAVAGAIREKLKRSL